MRIFRDQLKRINSGIRKKNKRLIAIKVKGAVKIVEILIVKIVKIARIATKVSIVKLAKLVKIAVIKAINTNQINLN